MKTTALLCLWMLCAASLSAEDILALGVRPCGGPPRIDGLLDDAAWKDAAIIHEFHAIGRNERVKKHRAMVTFDPAWLYAAFEVDQGQMERLEPHYTAGHDDFVQRDDCVKVSLDPGGRASPWYHFKLNRANVRQDRRIQVTGANEIQSWDIPWKSAVRNAEKNWTAEVAIPFCLLYPFDQLGKARLNLVITTFVPKRDAQGVVVSSPVRTDFSLSSVLNTCFEPERFTPVKGLDRAELQTAFLPMVEKVDVGPYLEKGGQYCYSLDLILKNLGGRAGEVVLKVEDRPQNGPVAVTEERVEVQKSQLPRLHRLAVPAPVLTQRSAILHLIDGATGEAWEQYTFTGERMGALDLFSGYLDRNYYTSEKEAVAVLSVRLPQDAMRPLSLVARDGEGRELAESGRLAPETRFPIPLGALPLGKSMVKTALRDGQKREMSSVGLEVTKRAPNPGREWKVDRVNRVLLNNGKPFFAMGFCVEYLPANDVATLKKLRENGFNFLQLWVNYDAKGMADYARMIEQEGLYVMPVPDDAAAHFKGPYTLKDPKHAWYKPRSVTDLKCNLCGSGFGSRAERNAVFREYMDWLMPDILAIVDAAKDSPANLGYFIFDEPQLGVFDQGQFGKELYDKIHERDGYHPVLVNYSSEIPEQEEGRNWMDILATDPYWVPGFTDWGVRGTVNFVSMITARTVAAGALRRQVPWSLPLCDRWSAMTKRGATPEEQFCQTYLAAIHGAKGIMYFVLESAQGFPPAWDAAAVMGRQFRDVLGPACVAPAVKHTIAYFRKTGNGQAEPVVHDPANGKFADIQMALLPDPAGGHILMAANSRYYPVACEVAVKGLAAKTTRRYFAEDEYAVKDGSFADPYEAYGVRAYRLPALPEPVEITVTATPPEKIPEPEKAVAWRDDRKNKMPNPSLEQCSVPGWPDYCFGYGRGVWETRRFLDDKVVKFGKQSVRIDGGFIQAHSAAPERPDVAGKYVFSIWLKGSKEGLVELKDLGMHAFYKNVPVTTEWQRYEFPFVMARPGRLIVTVIGMGGGSLWVDGLQLERGEKATEFEE